MVFEVAEKKIFLRSIKVYRGGDEDSEEKKNFFFLVCGQWLGENFQHVTFLPTCNIFTDM